MNTCMDCVRKHLGDANSALDELKQGYPTRRVHAVGELSHAAKESLQLYRPFSRQVRLAYVRIMRSWEEAELVDLEPLIAAADYVAGEGDAHERHIDSWNTKPQVEWPAELTSAVEACLRLRLMRGEPVPRTNRFPHLSSETILDPQPLSVMIQHE